MKTTPTRPSPAARLAAAVAHLIALADGHNPAAALARWQALPLSARREAIAGRRRANDIARPCGGPSSPLTLAEARRQVVHEAPFRPRGARPLELGGYTDNGRPDTRRPVAFDPPTGDTLAASDRGAPLDHAGWYCDPYEGNTYEPIAAAIAHPLLRGWVFPGYRDKMFGTEVYFLDTPTLIPFGADTDPGDAICEALREALVQDADRLAECAAEVEKDFQIRAQAENEAAEAREERATLAAEFRALAAEIRRFTPAAPAICATVRAALAEIVRGREALRAKAERLEADPYSVIAGL